jgi:hypothetical protein
MLAEDGSDQARFDLQWQLLWRVRLSNLYHLKRERFLDGADKISKALSALGGAAAFTQIRSSPDIGLWITGFIAVVATLSLVYSTASKARKHAELARDFKRLEAEITDYGAEISMMLLAKFESKYLGVESSEPATLGALTTHCHNQLSSAYEKYDQITPLPWYQSIFMNWFDFDQSVAKAHT